MIVMMVVMVLVIVVMVVVGERSRRGHGDRGGQYERGQNFLDHR